MPYYYALHFTLLYGQLVEERRPDVAVIHETFQANIAGGAPYLRWIRQAHPDWADLADAFAAGQYFPAAQVLARAKGRPVYVEPFTDLVLPPETLEARGLLARARPRGVPEARREESRLWRARYWSALRERLGDETRRFAHTRVLLLWYAYLEAALHLRRADPPSARDAIERGLALSPRAGELLRLLPWVEQMQGLRLQLYGFQAVAHLPLTALGAVSPAGPPAVTLAARGSLATPWFLALRRDAAMRAHFRDLDVASILPTAPIAPAARGAL